jgi:hypothetical protein
MILFFCGASMRMAATGASMKMAATGASSNVSFSSFYFFTTASIWGFNMPIVVNIQRW